MINSSREQFYQLQYNNWWSQPQNNRKDSNSSTVVEGWDVSRMDYLDEKIRSGVQIPYFLPYLDFNQNLGTTEEMVYAFRRMLANPECKAAILNNLLAVMSLDLKIHPADKKDKTAVEVARFVEWNLKHRVSGGVPGIIWEVMIHGCIDGYSVCEKVWEIQREGMWKGKRVLKALKAKDTLQDLVLELDQFRNVIGVKALRYNAGTIFHPNDFLIYSNLPLWNNPLGVSEFRAAYMSFWFLDAVIKLRFTATEKRAVPILVGECPPSQQSQLQKVLSEIKSRNWATVPPETKLKALEIAGSSNEYFQSFCRDMQTRIFLALSGAELMAMTSGEKQQRGDSSIHENTGELRTWHKAAAFCNVLNDRDKGLIVDMIRGDERGGANFNVDELPFATLTGIDDSELKASMNIDEGLSTLGWVHSKEDLSERYGRRFPTEESDVLMNPAQVQSMMTPEDILTGRPPHLDSYGGSEIPDGEDGQKLKGVNEEGNRKGDGEKIRKAKSGRKGTDWIHSPGPRQPNRWISQKSGERYYGTHPPGDKEHEGS